MKIVESLTLASMQGYEDKPGLFVDAAEALILADAQNTKLVGLLLRWLQLNNKAHSKGGVEISDVNQLRRLTHEAIEEAKKPPVA